MFILSCLQKIRGPEVPFIAYLAYAIERVSRMTVIFT